MPSVVSLSGIRHLFYLCYILKFIIDGFYMDYFFRKSVYESGINPPLILLFSVNEDKNRKVHYYINWKLYLQNRLKG